jgi:hypothetical protein
VNEVGAKMSGLVSGRVGLLVKIEPLQRRGSAIRFEVGVCDYRMVVAIEHSQILETEGRGDQVADMVADMVLDRLCQAARLLGSSCPWDWRP